MFANFVNGTGWSQNGIGESINYTERFAVYSGFPNPYHAVKILRTANESPSQNSASLNDSVSGHE